ncbi:RNA-directed DNA polymerase, eukaryota, reverse transcriptase zinc-binding domain protein [Tanacetum coccineum]|uniref:RNA-directed DNA polymerase, eukaryota, reverse transcriptase zinc-binding domain protein n=1 Tax=Tanacetum coccineum TaxID=301880 RepID=A0ABQ5FLM9_9ASTR
MTCITSTKFSINVNGERVGYFKGGRGLRQGDPISPYIFTLVMEVLNLLIQKNIEESKGFKYHFGCKNLKITHLCFVDDLLVFCHGDVVSVKVMKKSLDEFSGFSGLLPNMQKSTIFFGGLSNVEQQCIINIIPFTVGTLPVRYLGVPLLTKNLSINDCKPLISKLKAKVNDWKNKTLSYAGREQGGLGLKDLGVWNEVLMTKRLWNVAVKKDTLWIKWIYKEKLKDKSIWEAECDSNCTVGWKNILSLRVKIRKHVRWKVGNGRSVNVWHENWCSVSPLSDYIDSRDIYNARLNNNCTINDIINEGRWNWPEEWKSDFVELNQIQVPNLNEDVEDTVVCVSENGNEKDSKSAMYVNAISLIKKKDEEVEEHEAVIDIKVVEQNEVLDDGEVEELQEVKENESDEDEEIVNTM